MSIGTKEFEMTAIDFTVALQKKQQEATPVTLNSILSAWILMEKSENVKISKLIQLLDLTRDELAQANIKINRKIA